METKQVIVIRKDLNMGKGKMIAQAAHASLAAITKYFIPGTNVLTLIPSKAMRDWLENSFTKICVYVKSEEELHGIYLEALGADLPCSLIKDNGRTVFKEPTYTAVAVGPAEVEDVDKITRHLPLL